jgi:hypothetical protein
VTVGMNELFEELEFRKFEHPLSRKPAYAYSFGPFEIEAVVFVNRWLREGYFLGGVVNTGRTISSVDGELPLDVDSKEQGLALLSYFLARHIPDPNRPPWLRIGERMTSHLPWMTQTSRPSATAR